MLPGDRFAMNIRNLYGRGLNIAAIRQQLLFVFLGEAYSEEPENQKEQRQKGGKKHHARFA
jgi:hypothetical protein